MALIEQNFITAQVTQKHWIEMNEKDWRFITAQVTQKLIYSGLKS